MKQYEVLVSELVARYIVVDANSEKEAIQKVEQGNWTEDDVVKDDVCERNVESAEETTTTYSSREYTTPKFEVQPVTYECPKCGYDNLIDDRIDCPKCK